LLVSPPSLTDTTVSAVWVPLRGEGSLAPFRSASGRFEFRTGARISAEYLYTSSTSRDPFTKVSSPRERMQFTFGPTASIQWFLAPRLALSLEAAVDVDTAPRSFVLEDGTRKSAVWSTGRFRPSASLAIQWFFGDRKK
jgi:hypothetical protein